MRIGWLAIVVAMTAGAGASAETPAPQEAAASGASWDDSHMRARYQETPRTQRPRITGESGYGALASGSAESSTQVSEAIEYTSQRQWIQGALTPSRAQPSAGQSVKEGDGSGISRRSTLRANSVSSGRRRGRH
jgi:hypothetical protein